MTTRTHLRRPRIFQTIFDMFFDFFSFRSNCKTCGLLETVAYIYFLKRSFRFIMTSWGFQDHCVKQLT